MGNSKITYIILNVIRGLNILTILACELAAGSLLVKTCDLSIGWFNLFDLTEKVLIILFGIFLLITEIPTITVVRGWIARNWPLFSDMSGFSTLSICMFFLGCDVLSYLTKEDVDEKHLGGDFYRMCQAAGLMALIMSSINFIATFVLQDRRRGLTARQVRSIKSGSGEEVA